MKYAPYIAIFLLGSLLGWWLKPETKGLLSHVIAQRIEPPEIVREEKADSTIATVVVKDSGSVKGKATTTKDGIKSIKLTALNGTSMLNVDLEYDPKTDEVAGSWAYVAVREIIHYFKSIYERISYPTIETVIMPDTDDWQWFGIGSGVGVALSVIVLLLIGL